MGRFLVLTAHKDGHIAQALGGCTLGHWKTILERGRKVSKNRWAIGLPSCLIEQVGAFLEKIPL